MNTEREVIDLDQQHGGTDPAGGDSLTRPAMRSGGTGRSGDAARRAASRDTIGVYVPLWGTVRLSRAQLGYVAGIALLTVTEMVSWPVGLTLAAGHLLAADRDSTTLQEFGEALDQA